MGKNLRNLVEKQLAADLAFYEVEQTDLRFDWSESCIEGHDTNYLDGSLENFSGIAVFDSRGKMVAHGRMDFIHEGDFFITYWQFVTVWNKKEKVEKKIEVGIPDHVWTKIPDDIKPTYEKNRTKSSTGR